MSVAGGIPHNGRGPASPTAGMSWEEFCESANDLSTKEKIQTFVSKKWHKKVTEAMEQVGGFTPDNVSSQDLKDIEEQIAAVYDKVDTVNPPHYIGHNGIECHQVQRAILGQAGMGAYWHGCAIKYVFRALRKNGSEDIRKAIRCLQFWLDEVDPRGSKE